MWQKIKLWNILLKIIFICLLNLPSYTKAQNTTKDTFTVQMFKFSDPSPEGWNQPYSGTIRFPKTSGEWRKIYLIQKIKCDVRTAADTFPCGEWDYHTHTVLTDSTGERFELAGFITPYGKRLDLGPNGKEFIYDITDYAPILTGTKRIISGNNQELLDLKFVFIKGKPERKSIAVRNIYPTGLYSYGALAKDSIFKSTKVTLDPRTKHVSLLSRISGHGHFGPYNCCEWVAKKHSWRVNGEEKFFWNVWKDCGMNPIHPQGGTWQFDRAGWCPGTKIDEFSSDITPWINLKDTLTLDYAIEPPFHLEEEQGEYRQCHQLIEYEEYNFENDAAMEEIIRPTDKDEYARFNPTCQSPMVVVKNTGKNNLTQIDIEHGLDNHKKQIYHWNGLVLPGEKITVYLPNIEFRKIKKSKYYIANILKVNGLDDKNQSNNNLTAHYQTPMVLPEKWILKIEANDQNRAKETSYSILNDQGTVVISRDNLEDSTVYKDKIKLTPGCYTLVIKDKKQDGMIKHWWLRNSEPDKVGTNGNIEITQTNGVLIKKLPFDFADTLYFAFFVGKIP